MLPLPRDNHARRVLGLHTRRIREGTGAHGGLLKQRSGFTLVELVISMTILSFTTMVIGGLMLAITSAWDHSTSLEDSRRQAQASFARIKWMIQQSGTYKLTGQPTTLGIAILTTTAGTYQAPTKLVVWSGGSNGGMNASGLKTRLPLASEIVVYTPDPTTPSRLIEMTFPGNTTSIDFRSSGFSTSIASLMQTTNRQSIRLCDRLHVTPGTTGAPNIGNIRFEMTTNPSDSQISGVSVGSQAWNDLPWGQGLVGADRALRTTNVRIEMLLDPNPAKPLTDNGSSTALPFPASVNRQYVYQP